MCKKILFSISLVLVLALAGNASAGLVGHWKLDEGSGTTAADATGNGHDGTLIGNPQWVAGHLGGALEFSGSADKVDIPHSADLNPENQFTASVWANLDPAGSGYRSPITSRDDGPQRGYIIYCTPANTWQFWTGTGSGWNSAGSPDVVFGEWTHVAATYSDGDKKLYVNGELAGESSAIMSPNTQQVLRIGAGATEGAGNYFFHGAIDDVRVYDRALSADQVADLYGGIDPTFRKAEFPDPADGAMHEATWATLAWTPGDAAVSHDVYMADNFDDVNDGAADAFQLNQASPTLIVGFMGYPFPEGLVPGTTYYWRIDEVNPDYPESPWEGDVWSFEIPPKTAWQPAPADGVNYVALDAQLSWTPGLGGQLHTVYFGESFDDVNNATGGAAQSDTTFDPGPLASDTVYYWRVDEFEAPVTHKGDVWSFRTLPDIPITDPSLLAWWKLDEGAGANVLDWSGHGHHGTLSGDADWTDGYDLTAVQFDGDGDSVDFGTPADLYLASTYTYTAWFKPGRDIRGDSGAQYLLCIGSRSDLIFGVEDGVGVNGDLMLHYYDTEPGFHAVGVGKTSWAADEWHMVAGTKDAAGHKIYLDGELRNSDFTVNDDNHNTGRIISLGARAWTGHQYFEGAIDDVRIYNRALTDEEIIQVMQGNTVIAGDPVPARGATVDITDVTSLSWSAGDGAASHDVYFGTDRDAVAGADAASPEFQGNQAPTSLSLAGLVEFGGGDYYWRIDEVQADGTVNAGTIWKFTVPAHLTVDDIESYNDLPEEDPASNRIYLAWIDGFGSATNGAQVGNLDVPLTERSDVHRGLQAMPYSYDNSGRTSEATLTLTSQRDWTAEGVTKLSLWFRGDAANAAERMFFVVNDSAVIYHDDPAVAQTTGWTEWVIELASFADQGVDLTNVDTITIGFGTKDAPAAGGTGQMYFDDILLVR